MPADQIADKAAPAEDADLDDTAPEEPASEEPIKRGKKADPFADAFEAAEKALGPDAAPKGRRRKDKADAAADEEVEAEAAPAKQRAAKSAPGAKKAAPAEEGGDDAEDEGDDKPAVKPGKGASAESEERLAAAKKIETQTPAKAEGDKSREPLAARKYWPKERREAFVYQPREVQEAWLKEAPVPYGHWSEEQKTGFTRMPREAQEMLLEQAQEIERGYGQKFEALAKERKSFEAMKSAVSPQMRALMQQHGVDEPAAFKRLLDAQEFSMKDPAGYVRRFIAANRIDPRHVFAPTGAEAANGQSEPGSQPIPQQQADPLSHPVIAALAAEVVALKQARERDDDRRLSDDISRSLDGTDEGGNSRYPFIRLLAGPMSDIIEGDPEKFGALSVDEKIAEAYRLALASYPELTPPKPAAPVLDPVPDPEPEPEADDEDAEAEAEKQAEKLKKAATKKSKTPQAAPSSHGGDPFARAFARAERQIGHR